MWLELELVGGSLSEDTSGGLGLNGHGVGSQLHCERFHLLLFYWDCQGNFTTAAGESRVLRKLGVHTRHDAVTAAHDLRREDIAAEADGLDDLRNVRGALQLAAQAHAKEPGELFRRFAFVLTPDNYKVYEFPVAEFVNDRDTFLAMVRSVRWLRANL